MRRLIDAGRAFLADEGGPTAVEYAVMLAMIILVCIAAIKSVGTAASDQFTAAKNGLAPAP